MKKAFIFALALASVGMMSAQKQSVDKASKLAGKADKVTEARNLINEALKNPETAQDVRTYFTAGKVEFGAFDADKVKGQIDNSAVDMQKMGQELIAGYNYYLKALPLDSLPNEKGQVKPKYSKDIAKDIVAHQNDFFEMGANLFNSKHYPEAYEAFMVYADMPQMAFLGKNAPQTPDSIRTTAYFNAGLAGYFGNEVRKSVKAFERAVETGYPTKEPLIYQIACWQSIAQTDSTAVQEAEANIERVARQGYEKFGVEEPIFFNNLVNILISRQQVDQAIAAVDQAISANPNNANLYGLRGFVNDRAGNDDASLADYVKAASLPDVDAETLANASKKIFRTGQEKWNLLEGNSADAQKARLDIKTNYFEPALEVAKRAKQMNPKDGQIDNIIDSIDYVLTTYF